MSDIPEVRCGNLRYSDWQGFWKANDDDSDMTGEEWDEGWESLREWLSRRYLVDWNLDWQRHCFVDGDYMEPERTLKIVIEVPEVLTKGFLLFVQKWLQANKLWRVSVPTDDTPENQILVYSDAIRINPNAEANMPQFLHEVRPKLAALIKEGREYFGIRPKPVAPLPTEQE